MLTTRKGGASGGTLPAGVTLQKCVALQNRRLPTSVPARALSSIEYQGDYGARPRMSMRFSNIFQRQIITGVL